MSEPAQTQETSAADLFYPPAQDATTETESTGSTVEAEAVEVEQSTVKEVETEADNADDKAVESELDDDNSDQDDDSDEPLYFQVGDEEISIAEVKEGRENGLRQADYTRKTQALADDKKAFEVERQNVSELSGKLGEHIEALELTFKKDAEDIDWEHLREYDTSEYLRLQEEQKTKQSVLEAAKGEAKKLKDDKYNALIASETQKLAETYPEWADPATGKEAKDRDSALVNAYANDNGFTADDFTHLTSSNLLIAIHKAAKFDALKKDGEAAQKIVRKAPKTLKAGTRAAKPKTKSAVDVMYPNS